jgi:hypothetical protein
MREFKIGQYAYCRPPNRVLRCGEIAAQANGEVRFRCITRQIPACCPLTIISGAFAHAIGGIAASPQWGTEPSTE